MALLQVKFGAVVESRKVIKFNVIRGGNSSLYQKNSYLILKDIPFFLNPISDGPP